MPVCDKKEVDECLQKNYSELTACISKAFNDFHATCARAIPALGTTTVASVINDLVRREFTLWTEGANSFSTHTDHGGFFLYSGNLALRPKKIDRNHRSKNQPTKRVLGMKRQDCDIPGLENDMVFLTLGYEIDEVLLTLKGVYLINEGIVRNHWELRIDSFAITEQVELTIENTETVDTTTRRVRVKVATMEAEQKQA